MVPSVHLQAVLLTPRVVRFREGPVLVGPHRLHVPSPHPLPLDLHIRPSQPENSRNKAAYVTQEHTED